MTDQRGFTLIEMLVSMSIFAVITGFVMANYRVGQQGDELRISAQLVGSMVRRAQTSAVAGGEIFACAGGLSVGTVCTPGDAAVCGEGTCVRDIPRGYGVRFSTTSGEERRMTYFADTDGNRRFGAGETVRTDTVSSGRFVDVVAVSPADNGALEIVFVPPRAAAFYNAATDVIEAVITLRHRTTGQERDVRINRISGQVSID